ncbi:MAG: glycosyltransferase [Chryseosolibacter sp.]
MTVVFICYWSIEDGLTASTVIPHLAILDGMIEVKTVILFTIERSRNKANLDLPPKVIHHPLWSGKRYIDKFVDFTQFPQQIGKAIKSFNVRLMFCRGTPAGALGYIVHRATRIPYVVESFEPHAEYMAESGVWRRWGLRYFLQRRWEKKQMDTAHCLLPVSPAMERDLELEGVERSRIRLMPCAVNQEIFSFDSEKRESLRSVLNIPKDCVCGIYVGKFGGLYYDSEAFQIFEEALNFFPGFRLVILTPDDAPQIAARLLSHGFKNENYHVLKVGHEAVPAYLSAADFAFALYRPTPSKKFLSPVKVGEYWAVGLPVLISDAIGDASFIIEKHQAGAIFSLRNLRPAFAKIKSTLEIDPIVLREKIRGLALHYRSFETNRRIYKEIIHEIG